MVSVALKISDDLGLGSFKISPTDKGIRVTSAPEST